MFADLKKFIEDIAEAVKKGIELFKFGQSVYDDINGQFKRKTKFCKCSCKKELAKILKDVGKKK